MIPPPPLSFLPFPSPSSSFWGVPECNAQVHPSPWCVPGRSLVAGNTCALPSFLFLPFSLSLCLSVSLSLSSFFSPFLLSGGVPGCSRHSWEPFHFWCVLGRLSRSWEHLGFFLSLLFFSSFFHPSFFARGAQASATGFSMRFGHGLSSVCPLSFGSLFIGPFTDVFPCFLSCPSVCVSRHPHPFLSLPFSCARFHLDLSLYTYTRAYSTFN